MGHVNGIELLRESRHLLNELHIFFALVVGTHGKLIVDTVYLGLNLVQMGKCLARLVKNGTSVFGHQVLWQIGHYAILRSRYGATHRLAHPGNYLEQSALACAILAHKGYTVFIVYLKGNIPEKGGAAEFNGQSIYCDHICLLCLL